MIKKDYILKNRDGLTSRISSNLVSIANKFNGDVFLKYQKEVANLKSIMNVMALIIRYGEHFSITCSGEDEISASEYFDNYLKSQDIVE